MRLYFLLLLFLLAVNASAQDSTLIYHGNLLIGGSTSQTPFWIAARQYGSIPEDGSFGMAAFGLTKRYHPHDPRQLQWAAKAEFIGNFHSKPDAFFTDLYVSSKWEVVELLVGQQKAISGLLIDSTLSSGSLSMSGNARPYPKVQLSIPQFTPLRFTNGYLSVKASYSDGLLRESRINFGAISSVDRTFLHQKSLYFRLGTDRQTLKIYIGFNHQVVWGGEKEIDPFNNLSKSDAYKRVISGSRKDHKVIGNHFGTVDFGISWQKPEWTYSLYRQTIFESGSLFRIINYTDGLNGISIKRNKSAVANARYLFINSAVIEVIGTRSQHNANPPYGLGIFEYGNYFNHYIYQNGWSYRGLNMGNPLVQASSDLSGSLPGNNNLFTNNNRLWAIHAALNSSWNKLNLTFRATHSLNYGTYLTPFSSVKHQTAIMLVAEKKVTLLGGCLLSGGLSADVGSIKPNSYGLIIGVRKSAYIN